MAISLKMSIFAYKFNANNMDGLILIILGIYIFSKMFGSGDKKKKRRKRKSIFWGDTSTYSDYDAWNRSHGSDNKLF